MTIVTVTIPQAIEQLKKGNVVVYPTESSYALGADATNPRATETVKQLKHRPEEKQLPVICSDQAMVEHFFDVQPNEQKLAQKYWPGPLTLLLAPKQPLPVSTTDEVAVRVSGHQTARALSEGLGAPLIATSANISGMPACYSRADIEEQFVTNQRSTNTAVIYLVDEGMLPPAQPSTIVRIREQSIEVVRPGAVQLD